MLKNLSIIALLSLQAITVQPAKQPQPQPWVTMERQRSTDPQFDGLMMTFHEFIDEEHNQPLSVFLESQDLRKAWKAKQPVSF